jgi:hypothetical protein
MENLAENAVWEHNFLNCTKRFHLRGALNKLLA